MMLYIADYRGGKNGISAKRTNIQLDMEEVKLMLVALLFTHRRQSWTVGEYNFMVRHFEYGLNRLTIYLVCDGQKEFVLFDLQKGSAFISLFDPSTDEDD